MTNTEKIPVKWGSKRAACGYAVYSEAESKHSTNDSNKTYRVYTNDGTYFMHVAGWQLEKMIVAEPEFDRINHGPFEHPVE